MSDEEKDGQALTTAAGDPLRKTPQEVQPYVLAGEAVIIEWADGDPQNPQNWKEAKKYAVLFTAVLTTMLTAANCTSVAILNEFGQVRFGVSREEFALSLTVLMISIACTPLVLAPLSELYGRNVIYQTTAIITMLLFVPQALSSSFSGLLAARWFQGMSSSVGNSMVGGTVADMFAPANRGFAMSIFTLATFTGQSLGGVAFGWIGQNLGIQWAYGIQGIAAAVACICNALVLRETRSDVLLRRKASNLTRETGRIHQAAGPPSRNPHSVSNLIRPLVLLVTEPIVTVVSMWIGFAWAMIFLGGASVPLVFAQYGWSTGQLGTAQLPVLIGALLGWITNHHQEYLYRKAARRFGGKPPPEARLYHAAVGGIAFPVGMFIFAWTGKPSIPWIVPILALCLSNWGIYCMYGGVFTYLADAYETYSSSAQAAQSWVRNMLSGVLPLLAYKMYHNMGYSQASTMVAGIGLALSIVPLGLLRYGEQLRQRSKICSSLQRQARPSS